MTSSVVVWDIETVPDLKGFAAANGFGEKSDNEVRAELGDKFPKHIYHSIICIGAPKTAPDVPAALMRFRVLKGGKV